MPTKPVLVPVNASTPSACTASLCCWALLCCCCCYFPNLMWFIITGEMCCVACVGISLLCGSWFLIFRNQQSLWAACLKIICYLLYVFVLKNTPYLLFVCMQASLSSCHEVFFPQTDCRPKELLTFAGVDTA